MEYEQQKRVIYSKFSEDMMKFGVRSLFFAHGVLEIRNFVYEVSGNSRIYICWT